MGTKAFPLSRQRDLLTRDLDNEVLIYDLNINKAFSLNQTSAVVWLACDGKKDISQITELVSSKLNTPASEDLIWFAIDELKKLNLMENGEQLPSAFSGISRRDVIKKVGLGTMIALPIVSTIVAPTAVTAASTLRCNATCDTTTSIDSSNCPNNQVCCGGTVSQMGNIVMATGGTCQPFTAGCGLSC